MPLRKLALKRDPAVPIGQPAPLYLDCPCGSRLPVNDDGATCDTCGAAYDARGWIVQPTIDDNNEKEQ